MSTLRSFDLGPRDAPASTEGPPEGHCRAWLRRATLLLHAAILIAPPIVIGRVQDVMRPHAIVVVLLLLILGAIEAKAHDRPSREGRSLALGSSLALLLIAWAAIGNASASPLTLGAAPVAACGVAVRAAALHTLGPRFTSAIEPDPHLVVHGIYGLVRHPSELGLLLLGGGIAVLGQGLIGAFAFLVLLLTSATRVAREEKALAARFGVVHRTYARRTGLLLPRISI